MPPTLYPVTQHHIRQITRGLTEEYSGIFSAETIERYIGESVDLLGESKITCSCPCWRTASRASG